VSKSKKAAKRLSASRISITDLSTVAGGAKQDPNQKLKDAQAFVHTSGGDFDDARIGSRNRVQVHSVGMGKWLPYNTATVQLEAG
jgi:hypothetical protein